MVASAQESPTGLCRRAIAAAETAQKIPDAFLGAIARVESGRIDPVSGVRGPWPWTINAEGVGSFFATKAEAIAAVTALRARGVVSIDAGCLQVNLHLHPEAFASLEQAFDPTVNTRAGADLLVKLFAQTRSWPLAAAAYHSQTPTIGAAYQRQVLAEWALPDISGPGGRAARPAIPEIPRVAAGPDLTGGIESAEPALPFGRSAAAGARDAPPASPAMWPAKDRGLGAYRMMPVQFALRPPRKAN